VEDIVAKTLIAVEPAMLAASQRAGPPRATNCFELFGFDVLLDVQRRAWLLEVNTTPALNTDSPLDLVGTLGPLSCIEMAASMLNKCLITLSKCFATHPQPTCTDIRQLGAATEQSTHVGAASLSLV
jgi:hypothetical protein